MNFIKDANVVSRDGKYLGKVTGSVRRCQMAGCMCDRIGVRWNSDKRITWPSSKAIKSVKGIFQLL